MTKVLFFWQRFSGYMASCWKAMHQLDDVEFKIVTFSKNPNDPSNPSFESRLIGDLDSEILTFDQINDYSKLTEILDSYHPDVMVVSGWNLASFRRLLTSTRYSNIPVILASDNPYRGDLRQRLGKYALRRILRRASRIAVPGERGWILMRQWGVPEERVFKGLYGVNYQGLQNCFDRRAAGPWPKQFLFIGRFDERKGIDLMVDAYRRYRRERQDPWEFHFCGTGPLNNRLDGDGIVNHGFVSPTEVPQIMTQSGAFVLASRYDAWPLVIVESCSAGLPIVCSYACGSAVELVRDRHNGFTVKTGCAESLMKAMIQIHDLEDQLVEFGRRSRELAAPYSAEAWADRWRHQILSLVGRN